MKVTEWPVGKLKPYDKNPRKNDQAVDAVSRSIKEFGFRQPIVVDGAGVIIVGHTRWKAAKKLGMKAVPVHVADGLTAAQARAYRIADNKTNELAEWDAELLAVEIGELDASGFDTALTFVNPEDIKETEDGGFEIEEKKESLKPIKRLHVLISMTADQGISLLPKIQQLADEAGAQVHHAGN